MLNEAGESSTSEWHPITRDPAFCPYDGKPLLRTELEFVTLYECECGVKLKRLPSGKLVILCNG